MDTTSIEEPVISASGNQEYDPITFSVLLSRFLSIANEMTLTLEYTAWTSILALARDYSCAIYDAQPRQICMYDAIPIHTTSMHLVLEEIAETYEGNLQDGDIILCNAPYRNNTHVGDVVTATPVYVDGQHLFWSVTKGHQLDVGAAFPSSVTTAAKDVWQEGLHIPPVKIYDAGTPRDDVIDFYLSNVRYRDLLHGDLLAQLGSINAGKRRLIELVEEYGIEDTMRYVDAMIEYADRRTGESIKSFPDGEFKAEGWIDSDGVHGKHIPIRVTVKKQDDSVVIDFEGSGPQSPSGINGTLATSSAAPTIPFLYYIDPDIPHNQGCFDHFDVKVPSGTICYAEYPAATSLATITPSDMMHDVINKAMAEAVPDRVAAGGARGANMPNFNGIDARTGQPWAAMFFNNGGGSGAAKNTDGWPVVATLGALGTLKSMSIEQLELMYPLHVEEWQVEPDSMGYGQWIGGPGVRFSVVPVGGPVECTTFGDGCDNPPHGVLGGTPGIGGGQFVEDLETGRRRYISVSGYYLIGENERRVGISSGGGGYGMPTRRDPEQVRKDVRDGLISHRVALEVFGVVLSHDFDPVLDLEATEERRRQMESQGINTEVVPGEPGAATWLDEHMREGDEYLFNPVLGNAP